MPPIIFPSSTAPGKDAMESAGRLINAYAEKLQSGAPAQQVIRRTPGLTLFCESTEDAYRGMWYDGASWLYVVWGGGLWRVNSAGGETQVGQVLGGRIGFLDSATSTANLTTYSYAGVNLGEAHFNRRLVVAVFIDAIDDSPPASVTIAGIAATEVFSQDARVALYIAAVPTGASGTVAVTYAGAANRSAIGVWRLDGVFSNTAHHAVGVTSELGSLAVGIGLPNGAAVIAAIYSDPAGTITWLDDLSEDFQATVEAVKDFSGASKTFARAGHTTLRATVPVGGTSMAAASWSGVGTYTDATDFVTFAKNNALPPDQVLCSPTVGAYKFTTTTITVVDVAGELTNSVCFGEGYFFFTTAGGRCFASGINSTTVNALDVIRAEQRPEPLVRGIWYNGELYLWGVSHCEVWASRGNPNPTGFPLHYVTTIWRGLVGIFAIAGFEEGFEGGIFWVADDNSVRMLEGYQPRTISTPALERAIEACVRKDDIRVWVYDVDGHACVVVNLAEEATWVYDITEGGLWHERDTNDTGRWRAAGNSVKAWQKWICAEHFGGDLYQVDQDAMNDDGEAMPFIVESIAMESFPSRLKVPRAEFNFVSGVGDAVTPDPMVKISWSDTGGHRWTDPMQRKLGEDGRFYEHVRINGLGITGVKGRRFRLRIDDEVETGLLSASMEVVGLP